MSSTATFKYAYATDLYGDPSDPATHGWAGVAVHSNAVSVSLPNVSGQIEFEFTRREWRQMLEMFNAATEDGSTSLIKHDCMLYADRSGDILTVYRSTVVRDDDDLYAPVLDLIKDARLTHREILADEKMMFGEAEVAVYRLSAEVAA